MSKSKDTDEDFDASDCSSSEPLPCPYCGFGAWQHAETTFDVVHAPTCTQGVQRGVTWLDGKERIAQWNKWARSVANDDFR